MSVPLETATTGRIVTFYSYKGGVGRSMAMSNIAIILARDFGLRVVAIDWDLEAPGLNRYFDIDDADVGPGIIDYFTRYKELLSRPPEEVQISAEDLEIGNYVHLVESYPEGGSISFLSAGDQSDVPRYVDRVSGFDWDDFYRNWNGAALIEAMRVQLAKLGDIVLIDSRTGITDIGGICTLHLPDTVVLVFVFNDQNLDGIARIAGEISGKNAVFEITQRHPEVLFLPSRKDVSEIGQLREWEAKAVTLFEPFFDSPRITERFGDNGLDYIRAASVPYVPYFAFGEELAATTDKGYEMTAALEVLAGILCDRRALARKGPKAQSPRREPSFPGRRSVDNLLATGSIPFEASPIGAGPVGPVGRGVAAETAPTPTPSRKGMWALGSALVLVFAAVGVVAGLYWYQQDKIAQRSHGEEDSGSAPEPEGDSNGPSDETSEATDAQPLDPGLLRAVVRVEFLAIYPRDQPAPKVFDGSLHCDLALGQAPGKSGWTREWRLSQKEQELRASTIEDLPVVANAQSIAYRGFAPTIEAPLELTGREIEARLVGPGASPGWLTEAWARAQAQGLDQANIAAGFRQFYGIAADEVLPVEVTPVVATMQLEYDGKPFASLTGWVARDPNTRDLVVNFLPAPVSEPQQEVKSAAAPSVLVAPYIERRDKQAEWMSGIQGVGTYREGRGKRHYQLGIAVPATEADKIESVTYRFEDGVTITANKPGPTSDWPVSTTRKDCAGTVGIELRRKNGVTLPTSFDWCQDAVKLSPSGAGSDDPSQSDTGSCNPVLVAKNPRLAQEICIKEHAVATNWKDKRRLAESIIEAHKSYGDDATYCQWAQAAEELGDAAIDREVQADKIRCADTFQMSPTRQQGAALEKKRPKLVPAN